jgi:hypothetical protein
LTSRAPDVADRLGLILNVGEEGPIATPLQPLPDQGSKDDLQAHRKLERGRRLPCKDSGPVQDVLGENEENSRFIREHHASWIWPAQPLPDPALRLEAPPVSVILVLYLKYN